MTDKSVSQVALPAGTSITAPSISASHQGTRSLLCGVSPVPGSVGTGAYYFLEHLCSSRYVREGKEAFFSWRRSKSSCKGEDSSHRPCLCKCKASQTPDYCWGWGKTCHRSQHRFLGCTTPAYFSHLQREPSRLLAAGPITVSESAYITSERWQRQSHPQSHLYCKDSHQLGKKLDLYKDTYKS